MHCSTMKVSDVQVAEIPHECKKTVSTKLEAPKPKAKAGASAQPVQISGAREWSIDVPAMVNTKALAAKQELCLHRVATAVKRKDAQPASVKLAKIMKAGK